MESNEQPLDALRDIKALMERSSRFISLSGLAGVFSGIFALVGAAAAYWRVNIAPWAVRSDDTPFGTGRIVHIDTDVASFLAIDAILVLLASIAVSYIFTKRKARRKQQPPVGSVQQAYAHESQRSLGYRRALLPHPLLPRLDWIDCTRHARLLWVGFDECG